MSRRIEKSQEPSITNVLPDVDTFPAAVAAACPPDSDTGQVAVLSWAQYDSNSVPENVSMHWAHIESQSGVVSNFTKATDICSQPDLPLLHGSLFAPQYALGSTHVLPVYSAQNIRGVSLEMRVPSWIHWKEDSKYHHDDARAAYNWSAKIDRFFWRGGNMGGRVTERNWKRFHRHRFVAMTNSTNVALVEARDQNSPRWAMPTEILDLLKERKDNGQPLSTLIRRQLDVGFYGLGCWDANATQDCRYLHDHFEELPTIPMRTVQQHKYLFDIDGTGYSGENNLR
jgi:hypothetical protein